MTEKKPLPPTGVRMSDDMKEQLVERARQNGRSMNGEIVQILKEVLTGTAEKAAYDRGRLAGIEQAMNP